MQLMPPSPTDRHPLITEDGATIEFRRYGNPDGVRIFGSHGNGFAIDPYWPFSVIWKKNSTLVLFDLRSHGRNPTHKLDLHHIATFARDLESILKTVDQRFGKKPAFGIFHSVSAITALVHARDYRWAWSGLALIDPPLIPSPGHELYEYAYEFEHKISAWAASRENQFESPEVLGEILRSSKSRQHWQPGTHQTMADCTLLEDAKTGAYRLCCPGAYESQIYADNAELNLVPSLADIPGPLLFLCADPGIKGAWSPAKVNAAVAASHGHHYEIIAGSSHMLQLEHPEQAANRIRAFLTQAQTAEAFRLYFLSLAALVLAVLIFTGGFASARFYMEAGGGPQDVVTLRHGISGLLFLPFVVWIWEDCANTRAFGAPSVWRCAEVSRSALACLQVSAARRSVMVEPSCPALRCYTAPCLHTTARRGHRSSKSRGYARDADRIGSFGWPRVERTWRHLVGRTRVFGRGLSLGNVYRSSASL